jgi:hypothetical protein
VAQARHLTLLTRAYCSLCERMERAIAPLATAHGVAVHVVDVDTAPELAERWGDLVPVLFADEPAPERELCHYELDPARVVAALRNSEAAPPVAGRGQIR